MTVSNVNEIPFDREQLRVKTSGTKQQESLLVDSDIEKIIPIGEETFNRLRLRGIDESEYKTIEGRLFISRTAFNSKGDCSPSDNAWRFVKSIARKIGG